MNPLNIMSVKKKRDWTQLFKGEFLIVSIIVHLLFGIGAVYYVVQTITTKQKLAFKAGPAAPNASQHSVNYKVQMEKKKSSNAPVSSRRIVTTGLSKVALPEMPAMPGDNLSTPTNIGGMSGGGFGAGSGGGTMGMGGGGAAIPFFGLRIQTQSKRIALLLDYSGSMTGPFRAKMEQELEHFLKGLPQNTQVLIIPWAGPAWLYNQTGPQIASKWKMLNGEYDNFVLKPGEKLDPPAWISTNPESIKQIMKAMQGQVALSGGTDWRSPFRYAMEANPPPNLFYFMTDGQIPPQECCARPGRHSRSASQEPGTSRGELFLD